LALRRADQAEYSDNAGDEEADDPSHALQDITGGCCSAMTYALFCAASGVMESFPSCAPLLLLPPSSSEQGIAHNDE